MNPKLQAAAEKAVQDGLEAVDRRKGYRGPVGTLPLERYETLLPHLTKLIEEAGRRPREGQWLADLAPLAGAIEELNEDDARAEAAVEEAPPEAIPSSVEEEAARRARLVALAPGATLAGVVTEVCVAFPALSAIEEGFEVFVVTDASGTFNEVTRYAAWNRMAQAGAQLLSCFSVAGELHRDWRNDVAGLGALFAAHISDYRNLITSHASVTAAQAPRLPEPRELAAR